MGCEGSTDKERGGSSFSSASTPPLNRSFQPIPDRFNTLQEVQNAVRAAGLESSNLILGVDFTKSNTWTGERSFGNRCLHDLNAGRNPYQHVIEIMGRTLEQFDDDRLIPAFGFGDSTTGDKGCFAFNSDGSDCVGFESVLQRYGSIATSVRLAGPTCFAPVINEAIRIVAEEKSYHILVIIADGQVTDGTPYGATARAIVAASNYPLSIVVVGVGDGPWDAMESFDDELPARKFDNLQFVPFHEISTKWARDPTKMEAQFALAALMEIPDQYQFIRKMGLLNVTSAPTVQASRPAAAPPRAAAPESQQAPAQSGLIAPPNYSQAASHPSAPPQDLTRKH